MDVEPGFRPPENPAQGVEDSAVEDSAEVQEQQSRGKYYIALLILTVD